MNDNATGCAALVQIARVLQGADLERTVIFAFFAFEEDAFVGSVAYVDDMAIDPAYVINLEQIGFTSEVQNPLPLSDLLLEFPLVGDFIGIVASDFSKGLELSFVAVASEFVPDLRTYQIGADANL